MMLVALAYEERFRNVGLFTQEMKGFQEAKGDFLVSAGGSNTEKTGTAEVLTCHKKKKNKTKTPHYEEK